MKCRGRQHRGFNLVELMMVVAIIAVLVSLGLLGMQKLRERAIMSGCIANVRTLSVAFSLYAQDHDQLLPGRSDGSTDRWPKLLSEYVPEVKTFTDPIDDQARDLTWDDLQDNGKNRTSFFFNGFNDVGAFDDPTVQVNLMTLPAPSDTILLARQKSASNNFYMDFMEGNHTQILEKEAYGKGSVYGFADLSARFLTAEEYEDQLWLVDKSSSIPTP